MELLIFLILGWMFVMLIFVVGVVIYSSFKGYEVFSDKYKINVDNTIKSKEKSKENKQSRVVKIHGGKWL